MKSLLKFYSIISVCFFFILSADAAESNTKDFTYMKANEVNVRAGPNKRYPIKWIIKNKGEPGRVISQFENWTKIRDIDGDEGWVHNSMLNKKVHGILLSNKVELLHSGPSDASKPIARLKSGIRFGVQKCLKNSWCLISIDGLNGWIPQSEIWGLSYSK